MTKATDPDPFLAARHLARLPPLSTHPYQIVFGVALLDGAALTAFLTTYKTFPHSLNFIKDQKKSFLAIALFQS